MCFFCVIVIRNVYVKSFVFFMLKKLVNKFYIFLFYKIIKEYWMILVEEDKRDVLEWVVCVK